MNTTHTGRLAALDDVLVSSYLSSSRCYAGKRTSRRHRERRLYASLLHPSSLRLFRFFLYPKTTILARLSHFGRRQVWPVFRKSENCSLNASLGSSPLYASRVLCVFFALVTGYLLAAYPSAPAWSSLDWFVSTANTRRLSLTPHNTYHFSFKRLFSATFPPGSHALCWYCFVRDDCRC